MSQPTPGHQCATIVRQRGVPPPDGMTYRQFGRLINEITDKRPAKIMAAARRMGLDKALAILVAHNAKRRK
jgi:hypothetical protein